MTILTRMSKRSRGHGELTSAQTEAPAARQKAYLQVSEKLRQAINENEYPSGRLPTERTLGVRCDVSIGTVRKALDILVAEGIVTRRQGSGTYIARPSRAPLAVNSRRTHLLCYLSGTGTEVYLGNFFNRLMMAVYAEVERSGYATVLAGVQDGKVPMPVLKQKVDGVLVAGTYQSRHTPGAFTSADVRENNEFIKRVVDAGLPVVAVSNPTDSQAVSRIDVDYDQAIFDALSHLKEIGHRRIAVYGGPRNWPAFGQRIDAFLRQTKALGLESGEHLVGEYKVWAWRDTDAAVRVVRDHLRGGIGATAAIIVSGKPLPVLQGIAEAGIKYPEQFSLISFSDIPRSTDGTPVFVDPDDFMPPDMATLSMPVQQLASSAVQRLAALLNGQDFTADQRNIRVPVAFHPGPSIRPLLSSSPTL